MITLGQAHALLPGSRLVGDAAVRIERVHSDTRSLQPGDLFVALKGERFNAHDFLAEARARGAVAALAEHGLADAGLSGLEVADTQEALLALARAWRRRFHLPLIAVAGSNGKTTVTQMVASVLGAWLGEGAFATRGNLNNHIGLPLTLLRLRQDDDTWHRAAVVELGMNHPGEIALLAGIAAPTVALVNNAQREHQEFMASVEAVARENGAVLAALGPAGVAVFPADDVHTPVWHALAAGRPTSTFALQAPDEVHGRREAGAAAGVGNVDDVSRAAKVSTPADVPGVPNVATSADVSGAARWQGEHWDVTLRTPAGTSSLRLHVAGLHNVRNALAAAACALAAGCPLEAVVRGLAAFRPVGGRSQLQSLVLGGQDVALVDDTYNANPDSVRAAIDVLAALPAPRWLVLGDMGEVGGQGVEFHAEVGSYAQEQGIDALWTVGQLSTHAAAAFTGARHFDDVTSLLTALAQAPACGAVLVKGSRFMKMERVVAALAADAGGTHAA